MTNEIADLADTLNEKIAEFENMLQDLNLGVPAQASGPNFVLVFKKTDSGFQLFAKTPLTTLPLRSASRETRIQAVELFPLLYADLISMATTETRKLKDAIQNVDSLISELKARMISKGAED